MADDQAYLAKDQLKAGRPDLDLLENMLRRARLQLRLAMKEESAHKAFWAMQEAVQSFWQQEKIARIVDQKEPDEADFWSAASERFRQQLVQFYAALKATRYRQAVLAEHGDQLLRLAESFSLLYQPELTGLWVQEALILTNYRQRLDFYPDPLLTSQDRLLRRRAHQQLDEKLGDVQQELDNDFSQLLILRRQLAEKAGQDSYSSLAWQGLGRFDYDPAGIEQQKEAVRRYVLPLTRQIRALQQERLDVEHLAWYDLPCLLPAPAQPAPVSHNLLLAAGDAVISELSGQKYDLLSQMAAQGYLEFSSLPAWQKGLHFLALEKPALPYAALAVEPASNQVENFFLAAGMAYAARSAQAKQRIYEYQQAPAELELFFGLGLHYLALDYLKGLFGPAHDDYCLLQLSKALLELPLACLVDDFENRIYARPELTAQQCNEIWQSLEAVYLPDHDYEQMPFFTSGRGWQFQPAIWLAPHSSINQLTARLMALELWRIGRHDPQKAWQIYAELASWGGSDLTLSMLSQAGLASPLDTATLKKVAYAVCDSLAL